MDAGASRLMVPRPGDSVQGRCPIFAPIESDGHCFLFYNRPLGQGVPMLYLARIIHDSTSFSSPRGARAPSTSPDLIRIGV